MAISFPWLTSAVARFRGPIATTRASFGGNADQIYLCSRSSGSHLAGCVVTTEWNEQGSAS